MKWLLIPLTFLVVGCTTTPCVPDVKIVEVNVPVNAPAPKSLLKLEPLVPPTLPIDSDEFRNATDYDKISKDILESVNILEMHIKQLESRNKLYVDYIQSLPKEKNNE